MALVQVSLNTETRECVLQVDGTIVSAESISLSKYYYDYGDTPRTELYFEYRTREKGDNGLEEIHGYFLPREDSGDAALAHRIVPDDKATARSIAALLRGPMNSQ